MPFEGYGGFSFSSVSVQKNAPPLPGVYGLSNASQWIYVGAARDIQAALMAHLRETNTTLRSLSPKGFTFELCDAAQHSARQNRLVEEYAPVCNRR
jgi:excinuclease UvrABC nuclease subunit